MPSGHADQVKLNPLSEHALNVLEWISRSAVFPYQINPGVRARLYRENLIEEHAGRGDPKLWITDAGRKRLIELGRAPGDRKFEPPPWP